MILDATFGTAVVAIHQCLGVLELRRHWLALNCPVEFAELDLHVDDAPTADGTLVGRLHVVVVALMVDAVTTLHEDYRQGGGEHVLSTYRTVTVG